MKALTLTQPWATLMANGAKRVETRSWPTRYRGEIAIHAAKGFPEEARGLCYQAPFCAALFPKHRLVLENLPLGAIVAVVRLRNVVRTEEIVRQLSDQERVFGNYAPDRWAWVMELLYRVDPPVPCRGALGLWDVPAGSELQRLECVPAAAPGPRDRPVFGVTAPPAEPRGRGESG